MPVSNRVIGLVEVVQTAHGRQPVSVWVLGHARHLLLGSWRAQAGSVCRVDASQRQEQAQGRPCTTQQDPTLVLLQTHAIGSQGDYILMIQSPVSLEPGNEANVLRMLSSSELARAGSLQVSKVCNMLEDGAACRRLLVVYSSSLTRYCQRVHLRSSAR